MRLAGSIALLWLAPAVHAQSSAGSLELEWSAPAGCPDRAALAAEIERRVGEPSGKARAAVRARGWILQADAGLELELQTETDGRRGVRRLRAASCEELAEAAALIVALLIDPEAVRRQREAGTGTETEAETEAETETETGSGSGSGSGSESDSGSGSESGPGLAWHMLFRPEVVADLGSLPSLAVGPGVSVGVRIEAIALELTGNFLPRQEVRDQGRTVGELGLLSGSIGACYALLRKPALGPCARLEYGHMGGSGDRSLDFRSEGQARWVLAQLGARIDGELAPWLALSAEIAAGLPLPRPFFTVDGIGTVYRASRVVGRLRAGAELRF